MSLRRRFWYRENHSQKFSFSIRFSFRLSMSLLLEIFWQCSFVYRSSLRNRRRLIYQLLLSRIFSQFLQLSLLSSLSHVDLLDFFFRYNDIILIDINIEMTRTLLIYLIKNKLLKTNRRFFVESKKSVCFSK